jgi:hypothetical protein
MARLLRTVILMALIFTARTAVATTYYISKTLGSDSNTSTQAQDKTTPWEHLPGMPSCTANCASYTPVAGDQFILRGGDTWVNSDLGIKWNWAGAIGNPIYIGVDQTWFTGASWTRPIFDCGGAKCANSAAGQHMISVSPAKPYVTFDNIELKGWYQLGGTTAIIQTLSANTVVEHFYVHGWSRDAGETSNGSTAVFNANTSSGALPETSFHDNVVDGADTTRDMMLGVNSAESVYNNVFSYVVVAAHNSLTDVHGNLIQNIVFSYAGDHCDGIFMFSAMKGTTQYLYNNVFHTTVAGCVMMWDATTIGTNSCPACIGYIFNNVGYDIANNSGGGVAVGYHPPPLGSPNTGTYYVYNNTFDLGSSGSSCTGNGETRAAPNSVTHYSNNHCINSSGLICNTSGTTCKNAGTNLSQTEGQAKAAGYTSTQQHAYSPTSSSSPTVGKGTNYTSLCSTIPDICNDTSYATYNQTNHTVAMRSIVHRPPTGAWDMGAYQFSSSQTQEPSTPTNLQATVK